MPVGTRIIRAPRSSALSCRGWLQEAALGLLTFDCGNSIRTQAKRAGVENAFDIPGFVPEYVRPFFCEGKGPFRWVALSGDPDDIRVTDEAVLDMCPDDEPRCARFGLRINELVRTGRIKTPGAAGLGLEPEALTCVGCA